MAYVPWTAAARAASGKSCSKAECGRCGGKHCSKLGGGAGAENCCTSKIEHDRELRSTKGYAPCIVHEEKPKIKFCNSIGCPDSFIPVPNADNTKCYDHKCSTNQCCDALCAFHACPNNFIPVQHANKIKGRDNNCATSQCCQKVQKEPHHDGEQHQVLQLHRLPEQLHPRAYYTEIKLKDNNCTPYE